VTITSKRFGSWQVGVLIQYGFEWENGMVERTAIEKDTGALAYLDAFLCNFTDARTSLTASMMDVSSHGIMLHGLVAIYPGYNHQPSSLRAGVPRFSPFFARPFASNLHNNLRVFPNSLPGCHKLSQHTLRK